MKKISKSYKSKEEKYIFTEGINYFDNNKTSIWGAGDKDTLKFLRKTNIHGKWLNLAAGDGRYNLDLLKKADFVVASDIDEGALSKLWHTTPEKHREKLQLKAFNIIKKFPFKNNSFDGVFCAGTMHFFPRRIIRKIFNEIDRILKPNGKVIIDFATDVKRVLPNGRLYIRNEPQYTLTEAKRLFKETLKDYKVKIYESEVFGEDFKKENLAYKFSCKFILLEATKKK